MKMKIQPPGYWSYEVSGDLAPVVENYLRGTRLTVQEIEIMRRYLEEWIDSPVWDIDNQPMPEITVLRLQVRKIQTRADIEKWIHAGLDVGIDPL